MTLPLPDILICFADPSESKALRKLRPDLPCLHTGMGAENATRTLRERLRTNRPGLILSAGFAGGLNPQLGAGSLIWQAGPCVSDVRLDFPSNSSEGSFLSSPHIVITAKEKQLLWEDKKRDAVEMESEAIHQLAAAENIPSFTLRVISDSSEEDLPLDFNKLMTSEMKLSFPRLFLSLAQAPSKIVPLARFGRHVGKASRILGEAISATLPRDKSQS